MLFDLLAWIYISTMEQIQHCSSWRVRAPDSSAKLNFSFFKFTGENCIEIGELTIAQAIFVPARITMDSHTLRETEGCQEEKLGFVIDVLTNMH